MNKTIVISLGLLLLLAACDRKAFVKKITGTWSLDKYLNNGLDKTLQFDTTFREWQLTIGDAGTKAYTKSWMEFVLTPDSLVVFDTLSYDSVAMTYDIDTNRYYFIDTARYPHLETGTWELLNSEEDLQLRNDSSSAVEIFRILDLTKNNLTIRKGNEEFYLGK
ncbi:MAG TPA: hypothetical protein VK154_16655 [Chitinophagales bacterium]|nr:hypothetical protein [Chitinophagales bacterium]